MLNSNEYFNEKLSMLSELLQCSEEIMSSINRDNWEEYDSLGNKRVEVIEKINAFEAEHRTSCENGLSAQQRKEIDDKVQLILGFDKDIIKRLEEEKFATIKAINANNQERIIFDGYRKNDVPISGTFLDTKE